MSNGKEIQSIESLENVSGGYTDSRYDGGNSTYTIHCDNCGRIGAIPIGCSNHLCIECMQQLRGELGDYALSAILKEDNTPKG